MKHISNFPYYDGNYIKHDNFYSTTQPYEVEQEKKG